MINAEMLQEMTCRNIEQQEWVKGILSKMQDAAKNGATTGFIFERDHPELKDPAKNEQIIFLLRQRGFYVDNCPEKDGLRLRVDWNFTPTAKKFYDLWDGNSEFMEVFQEAMEGLGNIGDIIGAAIVAWMHGRDTVTCNKAEAYIRNNITPLL